MSEGSTKAIIDSNQYDFLNEWFQCDVDNLSAKDCYINIYGGDGTTFAIKNNQTLWTWGCNTDGVLGAGTQSCISRCSPGVICNIGRIASASSNNGSSIALGTNGSLWTWGCNTSGQLGYGLSGALCCRTSPGTVAGGGTNWCQTSSGTNMMAAIKTDGTLWTWGVNTCGKLGDGTVASRCSPGTVWGSYTTWCQVSGGGSGSVSAIKCDGTLWTWGSNTNGILGDGTTLNRCSPGTVAGGGNTWCRVFNKSYNAIAIKCDGTIWTWGCNTFGRLGDGTTLNRCSPGTTAGCGTNWCLISNGPGSAIAAIKTDGTLWTWGVNSGGRLGDGTTVSRCSPGTVAGGGTTWCKVSGGYHIVALKTDGTLWTWGCNNLGVLGNGTILNRCSPGTIVPPSSAQDFLLLSSSIDNISEHRQVSVASSSELPDISKNQISNGHIIFVEDRLIPVVANNECWLGLDGRVLRSDAPTRTLFSWGRNYCGQLGDGTTVSRSSPGTVAGAGTNWCQIANGRGHASAIKTDGTLWTWGYNTSGQLGDGTTVAKSSPGTVAGGGTTWCQVSNGRFAAAAIKTDGTLWTWGTNGNGELGNGTILPRSSPGTVAGGGTNWIFSTSANARFVLALKNDGTIWSWGNNSEGQLGDGTTVCRSSPVSVIGGGTNWCQISTGYCHSLAIKFDGTLWTWGSNINGSLGNVTEGISNARCSPGTIAGCGTNWCQVSGGLSNSLALKTDGTLWTWGFNTNGQLGDGTTVAKSSPGTVAGGGTTWCQVSNGRFAAAAIKIDGTTWTWGCNCCGQMGDGTTVNRCSPGTVAGGGGNWCQVSLGQYSMSAIRVQ